MKLKNYGKKRSMKERLLKEGPGAGYTITAKGFSNVQITSARVIEADGNGGTVAVEGTCTIDKLYAESYYYGTGKMVDIPAAITEVYIDDYELDDYWGVVSGISDMTEKELIREVEGAVYNCDELETMYGGGWMHSTYDGSIRDRDEPIVLQITDKDAINFIDLAVQGENYTVEYRVSTEYNGEIDYFEDEDSAVEYANKLAVDPEYVGDTIYVDRWQEYYDFYGDFFDYSEPYIERVYEVENELEWGDDEDTDYQESFKHSRTKKTRNNVNEAREDHLDRYIEHYWIAVYRDGQYDGIDSGIFDKESAIRVAERYAGIPKYCGQTIVVFKDVDGIDEFGNFNDYDENPEIVYQTCVDSCAESVKRRSMRSRKVNEWYDRTDGSYMQKEEMGKRGVIAEAKRLGARLIKSTDSKLAYSLVDEGFECICCSCDSYGNVSACVAGKNVSAKNLPNDAEEYVYTNASGAASSILANT